MIVALNFVGCQTLANALGDLCGLCAIGVWKEDDEFLPAPAPDCIGAFDVHADGFAQADEYFVADQMTKGIVVLFEEIDIKHDQA